MKKFLILLILLCPAIVYAQSCPKHLFYIDKTDNGNVLYYDAIIKDGQLAKNPVDIYWILEKNGKRDGLTMLEKPQFGINVREVTKGQEYVINVKNDLMSNRNITVKLGENGCAVATSKIKGQDSVLKRISIKIAPDSGVLPDVEYLDVFGTPVAGGADVSDRVVNKD
jgi:hypothetical protein